MYLLTVSENKCDSIMSYIIKKKDVPVGTTVENIIEKIIASIIVGSEDKPVSVNRINDISWTIQFDDYHYDICIQNAEEFILDLSGDLNNPIPDVNKLHSLFNKNCETMTDDEYIAFQDELKETAGIQSLGGHYNFG
mgnify:CR=1 FL=1